MMHETTQQDGNSTAASEPWWRRLGLHKHPHVVSWVGICLYLAWSPCWSGLRWDLSQLVIEVPVLIYAYLLINALVGKSAWPARFLPGLSLIAFYAYFDVYFCQLSRVMTWSDISLLDDLITVSSPVMMLLLFLPALALVLGLGCLALRTLTRPIVRRPALVALLPGLLLIGGIAWAPGTMHQVLTHAGHFQEWEEQRNIVENGRAASSLYYGLMRDHYSRSLSSIDCQRPLSFNEQPQLSEQRSVHLIVMESFVDPRYFTTVTYDRDPAPAGFIDRFGEPEFIRSPVFGGMTPQAEFELLCGLPAFAHLCSVECNAFNGKQTYALPGLLCKAGYTCLQSMGTGRVYYNAQYFYTGLGFCEQHFADITDSYLHSTVNWYGLFDGELLQRNSDWLAQRQDTGPIFNYVIGMYGHAPFLRDTEQRPDVVKVEDCPAGMQTELTNLANQFHYRCRALRDWLDQTQQLDPEALIIIVSDHLPPLGNEGAYADLGYTDAAGSRYHNPVYAFMDGQRIRLDCEHFFQIHHRIRQLLGDTDHQIPTDRDALHEDYLTVMARAAQFCDSHDNESVALPTVATTP